MLTQMLRNTELALRAPTQVRFKSGRVGVKAYVRRWYGYVYAEAEPRKGVPADSIDRTVTLRVASEAQSHALCAKQFHVIPMGVYVVFEREARE